MLNHQNFNPFQTCWMGNSEEKIIQEVPYFQGPLQDRMLSALFLDEFDEFEAFLFNKV